MKRIAKAFEAAKKENRAVFAAYLTAGYPNEKDFLIQSQKLLQYADLFELGIPYSDPLGDGPTIQQSGAQVLNQGMTTTKTLELLKKLREKTEKPIVVMTYYNSIYCYHRGEEGFLEDLKAAGADGMILPDLPPDEADSLIPIARKLDLDTIFLIAPTSTPERLKVVSEASRGFIYAVSVTGVTGARQSLPSEVAGIVKNAKKYSDLPIVVGFGISGQETAKPVAKVADGIAVGSALIKAVADNSLEPLAKEIAEACKR